MHTPISARPLLLICVYPSSGCSWRCMHSHIAAISFCFACYNVWADQVLSRDTWCYCPAPHLAQRPWFDTCHQMRQCGIQRHLVHVCLQKSLTAIVSFASTAVRLAELQAVWQTTHHEHSDGPAPAPGRYCTLVTPENPFMIDGYADRSDDWDLQLPEIYG